MKIFSTPQKSPKNFYRRHKRACKGQYPKDFCSGEFDERRKGWKRCDCPIFVSGVLEGRFFRRSTGEFTWDRARETAQSWEDEPPPPDLAPPPKPKPTLSIEEAVKNFNSEHVAAGSSANTRRTYGYFLARFETFSLEAGIASLADWTPAHVRQFRDSWGVSPLTQTKYMAILRGFFHFAISQGWMVLELADGMRIDLPSPARPAKGIRQNGNRKADPERVPFSEEEIARMLAACDRYVPEKGQWRYRWGGDDLADFIYLSVSTGLRISDVATFDIRCLNKKNECSIRTTKTGKMVYMKLPGWLIERLERRAQKYGPQIFGEHKTGDFNSITDQWRRKLKRLWALCGPWSEAPVHHRLRHTFARRVLEQDGASVRDVAELLGNTEAVVRKHYASWVDERQVRLERITSAFAENTPEPGNILAFPVPAETQQQRRTK